MTAPDNSPPAPGVRGELTFAEFRQANVTRCVKWHPQGINSWTPSDWLTAVTGELGELASLLKMRNRERDGLPGNKFSPTQKQVADEIADVLTYLDLLAAALDVDLGTAAVEKFNEVSERVGFPDRIARRAAAPVEPQSPGVPLAAVADEGKDAALLRELVASRDALQNEVSKEDDAAWIAACTRYESAWLAVCARAAIKDSDR